MPVNLDAACIRWKQQTNVEWNVIFHLGYFSWVTFHVITVSFTVFPDLCGENECRGFLATTSEMENDFK